MLNFKNRIRLNKDFEAIFKNGQSFYYQGLSLRVVDNNLDFSRFGIIISTKISKKAVQRNKLKRLIREFIKDYIDNISKNKDIIISVKDSSLIYKTRLELEQLFQETLKKAKLFKDI